MAWAPMEGGGKNLGFGFGLQLVLQLTRKLGWRYEAKQEQGRYVVSAGFDGEGEYPGYLTEVTEIVG